MNHVWQELRPLAQAAVLWALAVGCAVAQTQLPATTVTDQAEGVNPAEVPYAAEVLDHADIERQQVLDIRDATRDMVNVEVPRTARRGTGIGGTAGREGNTGFEIRGLGGNRVQTLVDGIPQPQADSFQNSHSFGRDYVDPLTLAGIEVHKGASDVNLPSGGIAGTVNMRTLSPSDLLGIDKTLAGRALLGWRSESQGKTLGVALAGKASQQWQWLLAVNGDWSDEVETMGKVGGTGLGRTQANPEDNRKHSVLGKLVFAPTAAQRHVLTVEDRREKHDIDNLHDFDNGSTRAHTEDMQSSRSRVSLRSDWAVQSAAADSMRTYMAWQRSGNDQQLALDTTTANGMRLREHAYDERTVQAGVQANKALGAHEVSYGIDAARTRSDTASYQTDRGTTTAVPKGPNASTTRWGAFVQGNVAMEAWRIQPGLRYESVRVSPEADSISANPASGAEFTGKRFQGWMPQLGVQRALGGDVQLFAHYQRGFRAPGAGEMFNYFGNITPYYGYFILPNPNLKAETSNNFELGLRDSIGGVQWEASAFYGRYRNFIERYADAGILPGTTNVSLQQSRNQAKATIKGLELKGRTELGQAAGGVWELRGGYGYTKGTGENGEGLESIAPQQLKLALGHKAATWDWQLAATHSAAKKASSLPADTASKYLSPSHTVWDLTGQVQLRKGVRLNMGLFNVGDKKYWNWSDVRGLTSNTEVAAVDAYSQPGRNVRVSLVADF